MGSSGEGALDTFQGCPNFERLWARLEEEELSGPHIKYTATHNNKKIS